MVTIRVDEHIAAPPEDVWAAVEDISSHVRWMEDAVAIRFISAERSGVGAAFDCDTKLGPFRLTDRMVVTEWAPTRVLGIRHTGIVTGVGRFVLTAESAGTSFAWEEALTFPSWMGGAVGGAAAAPLLRRVWRRNLANLKSLVEGASSV
jgi:Polyketide cyclase / dehydrase and lipid transport